VSFWNKSRTRGVSHKGGKPQGCVVAIMPLKCYVGAVMETWQSAGMALDRALPVVTEEAALVQELKSGSEDAFAYLLAVYQNPVFNLIAHILESSCDAADVLQEVFLKVFRGIRYFHGDSSLKTWIYRIAIHEASNYRRGWLRRLRREPFSLDDHPILPVVFAQSHSHSPYRAAEQSERQAIVRKALGSLPQPYRAVVVLREIEGMTYEEIAGVLGVAEGTVKSRLLRGRGMLRRKLAEQVGERALAQ
jgi:RNA polymerase sigma-70 factor, ECF subfamily